MEQAKHIDWNRVIDRLNRGWRKYGRADVSGKVCLVGAIEEQLPRAACDTSYEIADAALAAIIQEQFPERGSCGAVEVFNDHSDTTLDDVILVCEKARAADGSSWAS